MSTLISLMLLFAADAGASSPTLAAGSDSPMPYIVDLGLSLRFTSRANEPRTWLSVLPDTGDWNAVGLYAPTDARHYPGALLALTGEVEPTAGLLLRGAVDSGLLQPGSALEPAIDDAVTSDGRAVSETFSSGAFVRELSVRLFGQGLYIEAGRQYRRVAEGLVYEDFGTGIALGGSLDRVGLPLRLDASAIAVGHSLEELETPSPLVWLRADYELSPFESLGLFGGAFVDREGTLSDVISSSLAEGAIVTLGPLATQAALDWLLDAERQSRGALGYVGAAGNLLPADGLSVRAAGVASWGRLETRYLDRTLRVSLRGWAASGAAIYGITSRVGVGGFAFALSGDRAPRPSRAEARYDAFIGVAPYWSWTGIFFSGGLSQGLYPGRAAAAGVNGHGVVGGGASVELAGESFLVTVRGAYLRAVEPPPPAPLGGSGMTYGFEVDTTVEWSVTTWLTVAAEVDLFRPGNYFTISQVAYRGIGQLYLHVGN